MYSISSIRARDSDDILTTLPEELKHQTLLKLDLKSLLHCRQVCKCLKEHIDRANDLQYRIELDAAGMEHNPNAQLPVADCLDMLRRYQKAWNDFDFTHNDPLTAKFFFGGNPFVLNGGVFGYLDIYEKFRFIRLPSHSRRIEKKEWAVDLGFHEGPVYSGIDPSQDLFVWTTKPSQDNSYSGLHFRTMSTGEEHPHAAVPTLRHDIPLSPRCWHLQIRIMGQYVALQVDMLGEINGGDPRSEIFIWDWKKGERELAIDYGSDIKSFAFLSERHIIVAVSEESLVNNLNNLKIIDFKAEDNAMHPIANMEHVLTLCYPPLASGFRTWTLKLFSEPSPGWTPGQHDRIPFYVARDNRIFILSLCIYRGPDVISLMHAIPLSTFKQCIKAVDLSVRPVLKWSEWAPENTCLTPYDILHPYAAYGSRMALGKFGIAPSSSRRHDQQGTLGICDFNQLGIRKGTVKKHLPRPLVAGEPFSEEVQTRLEFAAETFRVPEIRVHGRLCVMCCADNVILWDMQTVTVKRISL